MTQLIRYRNRHWRQLAQVMALGLVLFAVTFLGACTDDGSTPATEAPQATATTAGETAVVQPTQTPLPSTPTTSGTDPATPSPTDTPAARETATPSGPPIQVVTTSNIIADWAEVIGGDRVEVFSLHSPGSDPHNIVPGARDVARVADADVVLSIGLGLEATWLGDLVHNASADESRVVALGEGVDPLEFSGEDDHHGHMDEGGDHDDHAAEELIGRLLIGDGEEGKAFRH